VAKLRRWRLKAPAFRKLSNALAPAGAFFFGLEKPSFFSQDDALIEAGPSDRQKA
jgi:hypothetical protein